MFHVIFLICLALAWIGFAVIQDLRKREIANWLNFSLIIFALGFRFFYSLFLSENMGFWFFYQGLIGIGIFFILGNLFYYARMFAGGDAKLLFALGAVLPFSNSFIVNLNIYVLFFVLLLFSGAVYGLFAGGFLILRNFKNFRRDFLKQFKENKNILILTMFFGAFFIVLGAFNMPLLYFGILILIFPYFYLSAKSIDKVCMIKKLSPNELTEGDWLYKDVQLKNKIIKKSWEGLTQKEIAILKKAKKKVLIRQGIPFSPVFLISFLILIYFWFNKINFFSWF